MPVPPFLKRLPLLLLTACCSLPASAQRGHGVNDTLLVDRVVIETGDTVMMILLPEVDVRGYMSEKARRQRAAADAALARLRYNVYKVYPYAVTASVVLKDVDANLAKLQTKEERKRYLKTIERELNRRFKGELENFTINQGQILVKLIDRQTGKNCYGIIRELKGGFSAIVYQSVALLFSNSLKREYDPTGRDRDIETIVQEIEARNRAQLR